MDGNVNCKVCTHYHHNGDQYLCDAGIFDVRVAGKAVVSVSQHECGSLVNNLSNLVSINEIYGEITTLLDKRTKAYKESKK